ncbi:MAG: hypothetical protein U9N07_05055 [Euryarchaeota archaeon]|nr:hypothetical protein [Euryarchaeota archaeon]
MKKDLANLKYTPREIKKKSKKIYRQILAESENFDCGNFKAIGTDNLASLFELYDLYFFDKFFNNNYREKISFRLSRRMTKAAGKIACMKHTKTYTISLSTTLISQTFHDVTREVVVNGIVCHDRLEATMRILEHEIIHLLEWVLFGSTSCSKPRFRRLSRNIFGHTDVTHQLVTQAERAHKKFNLRVGDEAVFEYDGETQSGIISRITKRATVMVKDLDGHFLDSQGNRYTKYYVPLQHLNRSKDEYGSN